MYVVDDQLAPVAFVETTDDTVASWFEDTYHRYREEATELTVDDVSV